MSKLYKLLLLTPFWISFTFAIQTTYTQNVWDFEQNCTEANVDAHYYIDSTTKTIYPIDLISNVSDTLFIRNQETSVTIWENGTDSIMGCGYWYRVSNVVPSKTEVGSINDVVVVWSEGCTLYKQKGVNASLPDAQIVYKIAYKREKGKQQWQTSNYYYYRFQNGSYKEYQLEDQTKRIWGDIQYSQNECFNIYIHFCGDWNVDADNWEQCDDWNNVNWDGCSSTCQLETPTCTLSPNPPSGTVPLTTTINATTQDWAKYVMVDLWDSNIVDNPSFPLTHTYSQTGNFILKATVQNNISPIADWVVRPTSTCTASVTVYDQANPGDQPRCGPANWQNFGSDVSDWPQTGTGYFCEVGDPNPYPVPFPQPGQSVSWQCEIGGSATSCSASRSEGGGWGWWGGEPASCEYLKVGVSKDNLQQVSRLELEWDQTVYFECKWQGTLSVVRVYEADSSAGTDKRILAENIVNWTSEDVVSGSYNTDLPDYIWCSINASADLKYTDAPTQCRVELVRRGWGWWGWGWWGYCGDGIVQAGNGEECDPSEVDENGEPTKNAIWCTSDCKLVSERAPLCAWVDPPSIMSNEYLFFWWKVDKNTLWNNIADGGCNEDNLGKWERRSLKCYFDIVDGNGGIVKRLEESCFNADMTRLSSANLLKDFLNDYWLENSLFWIYKDGLAGVKLNGLSTYGEYKIKFEDIKWTKVCQKYTDEDGNEYYEWATASANWAPSNDYGRECLMNFVVTRPYMMQLGSFVSTTENEKFDDFKKIDWTSMLSTEEKDNIELITVANYDANKIEESIWKLKTKYIFIWSDISLWGVRWQKARWAEIYYTAEDVVFGDVSLGQPTTFIIDGNLKIQWDIEGSSMWLVNWTIVFDPLNTDVLQQVEGIYIAKNGFQKTRIRNDDLNKSWSKRWDLEVKGILIWNGIVTLTENGRSILGNIWNSTFNVYELIVKGASLKVITNPRLWLLPPPGVLDLLEEVQKQSW